MRRVAFACVGLAALAALAGTTSRGDGRSARAAGALVPAPTGKYPVGTLVREAVDPTRRPFTPRRATRRIRIQVWYPAVPGQAHRAVYLPRAVAAAVARESRLSARALNLVRTNALSGAIPVDGRFPLIVFSPGYSEPSALYTGLLEDLASRGFIVAAVDHTYETIAVELPGHGVARATLPATAPSDAKTIFAMIAARKADVRSAVEVLAKLDKTVLSGAVDLTRIGVFGHSLGGLTSAHVLAGRNSRFTCGVDLDGSVYGIHTNVRQPFLIFTERPRASTIGRFWNILLGERHWFVLNGSKHLNFSDWTWLYPQIRPRGRRSPVANLLGRIGGERALVIERAYVEGFFSSCLRGERSPLLDGSTRPYPEVKQARQPRR